MWSSTRRKLRRQMRTVRALFDEGAYEEAESLLRHLIPDCDEVFGGDHRESIGMRNLLGSVFYQQRELASSVAMHGEAVERAVRVLGPDDPATLGYAHNYGAALAVQGGTPQAIAVLDDTLRRRVSLLGDSHEDALATASTLGATLFTAGAVPESLTLLHQAHEASRRLPEGHHLREEIAANLRIALRNSGR